MRIFDLDGQRAGFLRRIIVAAWEYGIPNKDHLVNRDPQDVTEFANSIGLVDAMLGDIDGSRAPPGARKIQG